MAFLADMFSGAQPVFDQSGKPGGLSQFGELMRKLAVPPAQQAQQQANTPSAIQEYQYYMGLSPEERENYLRVKRAQQALNLGGSYGILGADGGLSAEIPKTLAPADQPINAAAKSGAQEMARKDVQLEMNPQIAREEVAAKNIGTAASDAAIALPDVTAAAELQIQNINDLIGDGDKVKAHPGLSRAVGPLSSKLPTVTDDVADFESRLEQIKSGAFLQSIKNMQGFGALSNEEGAKAEAAATRMKAATSEEGFVDAAKEYRTVIAKGVERMAKKAQGDFSAPGIKGGEVPITKSIGGKTYIQKDGQWYEQ